LQAGHRSRLALHELVLDDLRAADECVLAEGDRPVVVGEVLAIGRGRQRAQVKFAECLRAADAARGSDRDREASQRSPSSASRP
jgi:hypothetical protein